MAIKATFVTLGEAAERLGVHESTARRYADRGLIRAVRLPSGVRRLHSADVEMLAGPGDALEAASGEAASRASSTRTFESLAAEQGARPLTAVEELAAPDLWESDEDVDMLIAMTHAERDRDR